MRYLNLIFTKHAQDQIKNRGIKISDAWETVKYPTTTSDGKYGGSEFVREFDDYKITVVATKNSKSEWIIKSVWRNPPLPGTDDARQNAIWKKYKKSGFWGKIFINIKQQLGF